MTRAIPCFGLPIVLAGAMLGCGKSSDMHAAAPRASQSGLIKTTKVELQPVADTLDLAAKVQSDPARVVHVFPPAGGRVTAIQVTPGERVRKGQTLAILQSSDIAGARADYEKARIEAERSARDLKRASLLYEHQVMPEKDYLDAQAAKQTADAELARTRQHLSLLGVPLEGSSDQLHVTAPRGGVVLDIGAAAGEFNKALDAQQPICTIADLDHVWIVADVYEKDLATVRPGAPVEITVSAYPGRVWRGKINSVSGALDPTTRSAKAKIVLLNNDLLLKPEMFASIRLKRGQHDAIVLPTSAITHEGNTASVLVRNSDDKFETREVKLGPGNGQRVEVAAGLNSGEQVVVEGAELLRDQATKEGPDQ